MAAYKEVNCVSHAKENVQEKKSEWVTNVYSWEKKIAFLKQKQKKNRCEMLFLVFLHVLGSAYMTVYC